MTDPSPTHCGHDPRYIVQADEGTAYCALCELEAAQREAAQSLINNHAERAYVMSDGKYKACSCDVCSLAREILK